MSLILGSPVRGTIYKTSKVAGRWRLTQRFGCTGFSWEPRYRDCPHFHRGIDIWNGSAGDAVLAPLNGKVRISQREPNGEHIIALQHGDGVVTLYGHLRSRNVVRGERVTKGQKIGEVGSTGNSTGPHLHFALRRNVDYDLNVYDDDNGNWKDPWPLLEQNVTVRPKADEGIRIRREPTTDSESFAETKDERLVRFDGKDLGDAGVERKWGGTVTGGAYEIDGVNDNRWERMLLDGSYRYIALMLAVRSI